MLGENFNRQHFEILFLSILEKRLEHFLIVLGNRLWNAKAYLLEKNITSLLSAAFAEGVVMLNWSFETTMWIGFYLCSSSD